MIACVGGGSNAIGAFYAFLEDESVELIGVEAGGDGLDGRHGASLVAGRTGILHGTLSSVLADEEGQILEAHSISAGLDYPGVGPEHAQLRDSGRARYEAVTDAEALRAFRELARLEGILPALEPAHAIAWLLASPASQATEAAGFDVVCLSGRGDKDLAEALEPPARARWLRPSLRASRGSPRHSARRASEGRAALMPYLMGGFPDAETSLAVAESYAEAGADLVELGVPFSDPLADGPVIHAAATRALAGGATLEGVLSRSASGLPGGSRCVPMVYANMVLGRGAGEFARLLADAGAAGVILPDLPLGGGGRDRRGAERRRHRARAAGGADDARLSAAAGSASAPRVSSTWSPTPG